MQPVKKSRFSLKRRSAFRTGAKIYLSKKKYFGVRCTLTVTKTELYIYGVNDENNCPYCKEPDSILHTFVECHYTQTFYVKVVDWFNAKFNCAISPTSHDMLFGTDLNTSRNNELKLNYCLLFAKYYLYYQKMYYKACNITEFVLKLEQKLLIESRLKRNIFV